MTKAEIRAEVFRRLREVSSAPVFWTEADVDTSVNEGYLEISDMSEWNEKFQTMDILLSRPYYDARTAIRANFLVLGQAYNTTTSRWLRPQTTRDLDLTDFRWERRYSEPECILVRGLFHFQYWPVKAAEVGKIKQYFIALPDLMEADTDEPGFDKRFHYALVEYALWDLFAQDGEVDLAWASWKEYLKHEANLIADCRSRARVPTIRGYSAMGPGSNY